MTPLPERNAAILKMLAAGWKQREVAKHFKTTRRAVAAVVRRSKDPTDTRINHAAKPSPDRARPKAPAIGNVTVDRSLDAALKADFIARKGVTKCPPVALVPTQATLQPNPNIDSWLNRKTGWPASDGKTSTRRRKLGAGGASSMKSCRVGSVI